MTANPMVLFGEEKAFSGKVQKPSRQECRGFNAVFAARLQEGRASIRNLGEQGEKTVFVLARSIVLQKKTADQCRP